MTKDKAVLKALGLAVRVVNGLCEDELDYRDREALHDLRVALLAIKGLDPKPVPEPVLVVVGEEGV
jgi:hypothetical protein